MGRTDLERYTQALTYLTVNVDAGLAISAGQKSAGQKKAVGKAISLAKGGFWKVGTAPQRMALRALLLCQQVFFKPPESVADFAGDGSATKAHFKLKSEAQIKDAIRCFTTRKGVSRDDFAESALSVTDLAGKFEPTIRTRGETTGFGGTTNCYGAVSVWLFTSGCCSMPWFLKGVLNAYTANAILGDGEVVKETALKTIPKGHIFNIHDASDPNICHWGVSLGDGWAAASNTTPGENGPNGLVMVNFRKGDGSYGEFSLDSAVEVCKLKYTSHKVLVKHLDPTKNATYY